MKNIQKTIFFILIVSNFSFAQSTLISPTVGMEGNYTLEKVNIQTANNAFGFEHSNGTISVGSFIGLIGGVGSNAGWLMTKTNHPLCFSTNSQTVPAMTLAVNGNVGIGVNNPLEKLHVNGSIRVSSLTGASTRPVYANSSGILVNSVSSYTLGLPRSSFLAVSGNDIVDTFNGGVYCVGATVGFMEAPVNVPDAATITSMSAYFADNSVKDIRIELHRRTYVGNTSTVIGTITSSGASGNTNILSGTISVNANNIVDNATYLYYLRVFVINSMNTAVIWDGTNLTINQVKLIYSY